MKRFLLISWLIFIGSTSLARAVDTDMDGIVDLYDACPIYANALPFTDTNGDGILDDCQCSASEEVIYQDPSIAPWPAE